MFKYMLLLYFLNKPLLDSIEFEEKLSPAEMNLEEDAIESKSNLEGKSYILANSTVLKTTEISSLEEAENNGSRSLSSEEEAPIKVDLGVIVVPEKNEKK